MNSLIKYYGSKFYMKDTILEHFPKNYDVYVEGFGGGASILFSKKPNPLEVYNDLGENVYSIFKVLQDKDLFEQFKTKLELTYYSAELRDEFKESLKTDNLDIVDRAYKYFFVNRTSFNGTGGFSVNLIVRRNMSKSVSDFLSSIDYLEDFHLRLQSVIIEHKDILDLIDRYDNSNVFFYLDPPYVHSTRTSPTGYEKEMSDEQHINMLKKILNSKGKFLISGYDNEIYKILTDNGFNIFKFPSPNTFSTKTECLWYNYDIDKGFNFK